MVYELLRQFVGNAFQAHNGCNVLAGRQLLEQAHRPQRDERLGHDLRSATQARFAAHVFLSSGERDFNWPTAEQGEAPTIGPRAARASVADSCLMIYFASPAILNEILETPLSDGLIRSCARALRNSGRFMNRCRIALAFFLVTCLDASAFADTPTP